MKSYLHLLKMHNSNFNVTKLDDIGLTYGKNGIRNFLFRIKKVVKANELLCIVKYSSNVQDMIRAGFKIGDATELRPSYYTLLPDNNSLNLFLLLYPDDLICYVAGSDLKNY